MTAILALRKTDSPALKGCPMTLPDPETLHQLGAGAAGPRP